MADPFTMLERHGLAMATVMARKGVDPAAIEVAAGDVELRSTGPGTWLAIGGDPEALAERLRGLAAVSDQSSGYIVYRLSGEGARTLLRRGAFIDLHPSAFSTGSVAVTMIAHIGVILWQVDDEPTFDVALFRSFDESFRHWAESVASHL